MIAFLNSYINGISGGDKWILEVCKRLEKKGVKVEIVTSKLGYKNFSKFLSKKTIWHITTYEDNISNNASHIILLYLKRIAKGMLLNLQTSKNDILFASSTFFPDILPILFKNGIKITIFHMIPPNPFYGYRGFFLKKVDIRDFVRATLYYLHNLLSLVLFRISGGYIFALPTTYDYVKKLFQKDKIYLTLNGTDFDSINSSIKDEEKEYDACWIGRVHPQKGVDDLINIWKIVTKYIPEAKLVLAGKGTEEYKKVVQKERLSKNIEIRGFIGEKEKYELIKKSKLFLFPSYYESFPITVLEVLSCGVPIIAYDLPVYRKAFPNFPLILIRVGDVSEFAHKVISLSKEDRWKMHSIYIGKNIRKILLNFTWDRIAEGIYETLKQIRGVQP